LKKLTGSVRFYKPKTKKIEPNQTQTEKTGKNRAKTDPNQKNRAKLVFVIKNRTETGRFEPVLVFFKKN
jgi:hypothetical protein